MKCARLSVGIASSDPIKPRSSSPVRQSTMSSAISGCINDRYRLSVGSSRACIWLQNELPKLSGRTPLAYAILELNNNTAERFGRGIAIGREYYMCVRSDCGVQTPATIYSLMEVDKLNCVDRAA